MDEEEAHPPEPEQRDGPFGWAHIQGQLASAFNRLLVRMKGRALPALPEMNEEHVRAAGATDGATAGVTAEPRITERMVQAYGILPGLDREQRKQLGEVLNMFPDACPRWIADKLRYQKVHVGRLIYDMIAEPTRFDKYVTPEEGRLNAKRMDDITKAYFDIDKFIKQVPDHETRFEKKNPVIKQFPYADLALTAMQNEFPKIGKDHIKVVLMKNYFHFYHSYKVIKETADAPKQTRKGENVSKKNSKKKDILEEIEKGGEKAKEENEERSFEDEPDCKEGDNDAKKKETQNKTTKPKKKSKKFEDEVDGRDRIFLDPGRGYMTPWPDHFSDDFVIEYQYAKHEQDIRKYKIEIVETRRRNVEEARRKGELSECAVCLQECTPDDVVSCTKDHPFCKQCVRSTLEPKVNIGVTQLSCLSQGCDAFYATNALSGVLEDVVFDRLVSNVQQQDLKQSHNENVKECPLCSNNDPSCIWCRMPEDRPAAPQQIERNLQYWLTRRKVGRKAFEGCEKLTQRAIAERVCREQRQRLLQAKRLGTAVINPRMINTTMTQGSGKEKEEGKKDSEPLDNGKEQKKEFKNSSEDKESKAKKPSKTSEQKKSNASKKSYRSKKSASAKEKGKKQPPEGPPKLVAAHPTTLSFKYADNYKDKERVVTVINISPTAVAYKLLGDEKLKQLLNAEDDEGVIQPGKGAEIHLKFSDSKDAQNIIRKLIEPKFTMKAVAWTSDEFDKEVWTENVKAFDAAMQFHTMNIDVQFEKATDTEEEEAGKAEQQKQGVFGIHTEGPQLATITPSEQVSKMTAELNLVNTSMQTIAFKLAVNERFEAKPSSALIHPDQICKIAVHMKQATQEKGTHEFSIAAVAWPQGVHDFNEETWTQQQDSKQTLQFKAQFQQNK